MARLFKLILILAGIGAVFAGGYWLGHRSPGGVQRLEEKTSTVKKFFSKTESRIEQSTADVQIKWRRHSALDGIRKALDEYERHNYGNAELASRRARQDLEKWTGLAPSERSKLKGVIGSLEEAERLIRKESPRTREALNEAKRALEKI